MPEGFCGQCNGKCCTELSIYVTHRDIQRLAGKVHVHPTYFLNTIEGVEEVGYPLFHLDGKRIALALTRPNERCVFLMDVAGMNRCGVQDAKPLVCAVYPFNLDEGDEIVHSTPYKCPGRYWPSSQPDIWKTRAEIGKFRTEYEEFGKVVASWNSKPEDQRKDFTKLVDFIMAWQ